MVTETLSSKRPPTNEDRKRARYKLYPKVQKNQNPFSLEHAQCSMLRGYAGLREGPQILAK